MAEKPTYSEPERKIKKLEKETTNWSVDKQKLALYDKWLSVCPDAIWSDVITALEKANELTFLR